MKKIYCFALILLSLFSCVIFSACGNKYKDLKMEFYSSSGEVIEEIEFVIDESNSSSTQRVGIEFSGIKKKDIGQIKVYSLPSELVLDTNYVYSNNMCYVDIAPLMPSSGEAKLVVSHLASGKKKEIDLNIEQKSQNLKITNSKYIISIPDEGEKAHVVDFSNLLNLMPVGSTDKVFFKILENNTGVEPIPAMEGLEEVWCGFNVTSTQSDEAYVKIYPVTYMEGYEGENRDKYINEEIYVYFRKTLNDNNLIIDHKENVDLNNLQLVANDDKLNSFKLNLKYNETPLIETNFFDMYQLEVKSSDLQKVSAFVEGNNDIVVIANVFTEDLVEVEIALKPMGYVGEIVKVKKSIFVKGEVKADRIDIRKNGEIISNNNNNDVVNTNIFDYYEEGNSLGALFTFTPSSFSGVAVNHNLNKMKIYVKPEILCKENCSEVYDSEEINPEIETGVRINDKLYSLMIHLFNDYLDFRYDKNTGLMESETIDQNSRIYIKYVNGNPKGVESTDFKIKVNTILSNEIPENWTKLELKDIELNFNRLEGVKSMSLEAGYCEIVDNSGVYYPFGDNPEKVYLDRLDGLDNANANMKYVSVKKGSVTNVDNSQIAAVKFDVKITALFEANNPLTIYDGLPESVRDVNKGLNSIEYSYNAVASSDVVWLIFNQNTDIGDYKITFSQEGIEKGSVICQVYEHLNGIYSNVVDIETNKTAFSNVISNDNAGNIKYKYPEYQADYIVASGQNLNISINLKDEVLNSNVVAGYDFSYEVGTLDTGKIVPVADKTEFFNVLHDDITLNHAVMKFFKGTYVDKPQYVYLTITVKTKIFENLTTISNEVDDTTNKLTICFFIYDEIKNEDISINHISMTRYFEQYLGVYYKDQSKAELKIEMADKLWNYVTKSKENELVDWQIDNENLIYNSDLDGDGTNDYYNKNGVTINSKLGVDSCIFKFNSIIGPSSYTRIAKAYIYQFDKVFEFRCVFNVEKPIITEKVRIHSNVEIRDDENQEYYINLKEGEEYKLIASNYSSKGVVANSDVIIQVADSNGSAFTARDYFDVDQTNGIIKVKKVDGNHKFKLIVFAKDALQYIPSSDKSGYNNPSSFLMDFDSGEDKGKYLGAYFVMDIELSNGTETNPYLIQNANDFWQIDDTDEFKSAYYKLMTSISLDSTTDKNSKTISSFSGQIITDNQNIYTIDGITLNNDNLNLFSDFGGTIENIKFIVNYAYNLNLNIDRNLGLFDVNKGTLTDVSVFVYGQKVVLNRTNNTVTYNFGTLVGENFGIIKYSKTFGVDGTIYLEGNATTHFGGLVGKNFGNIIGCEEVPDYESSQNSQNSIVLNTTNGREKVLSKVEIHSTLSGQSSIGGVVGYNTYNKVDVQGVETTQVGTIQNAFVQANITAEETSNVGGVIGVNDQEATSIKIYNDDTEYITRIDNLLTNTSNAIYNVKSASTINAKDNVGGIVGVDTNGIYIECDYQILKVSTKVPQIQANSYVGGIAGKSDCGKFAYCSVMSYWWNYADLQASDKSNVITSASDITGLDYVGGIVGYAVSSSNTISWQDDDQNPVEEISINDRVIVTYSSVNAYLEATNELNGGKVGNIGGILSSNNAIVMQQYKSIVFNAYFIGKLDGKVNYQTENLCLDHNNSSIYNVVYTLNLEQKTSGVDSNVGSYKNGVNFIINANPDLDYWWWNQNINGGYIFVTNKLDGEFPIFDLSPDSISVEVNNETNNNLKQVLRLEYHDFSQNTKLNDIQLSKLDKKYNENKYIYKIDVNDDDNDGDIEENIGLVNIEAMPEGIGAVAVNVRSTKSSVMDITFDGRILINGVGECELIFSSVLNPSVNETIKVVVDYPIGDEFNLSTSKTDASKIIDKDQIEEIAKDKSRQYYVITSGAIDYDFDNDGIDEEYSYRTKENVCLKVVVNYQSEVDANFKVSNYVSISGQTGEETVNGKNLTVDLNNQTPIIISVLDQIDNLFELEFVPYTKIAYTTNDFEKEEYENKSTTFKLSTLEGATKISFSYDDAIVYPNDTVYLTSHIVTDKFIQPNEIYSHYKILNNDKYEYVLNKTDLDNNGLYYQEYYVYKISYDISGNIVRTQLGNFKLFVDSYDKYANKIQTIVFRVEFYEINLKEEANLEINAVIIKPEETIVLDRVVYTIIPQRINKIEIKNYYYKNEYEKDASGNIVKDAQGKEIIIQTLVQDDILKPNNAGYMIVDIVPENGYYSYLEISDITGNEEILFIEVDDKGNALSLNSDPSSDNKGIKIFNNQDLSKKRIFIRTQIDKTYSSKLHTIEIRAYSNNGRLLYKQTKLIDVKMLPEINVDYLIPDGSVYRTANSSEIATQTGLYLAKGVDAEFKIATKNANGDLEIKLSGELADKYEFKKDVENFYVLNRIDAKNTSDYNEDVGKTIALTFTTYAYLDNGDFEIAECYVEFKVIDFVIHDISVNSSIDSLKQIYGYFEKPIKLNFYFDKNDISFYDTETENEPYWDTVYEQNEDFEKVYEEGSPAYEIYSILNKLNSYKTNTNDYGKNEFLILNDSTIDDDGYYSSVGLEQGNVFDDENHTQKIQLYENKLTVKEGYNKTTQTIDEKEVEVDAPKYMAVAFNVYFNSSFNSYQIADYKTKLTENYYTINKNYNLNFIKATSWYEPEIVQDEEDFLKMASGGRYLLVNDLVLENYSPLDLDLVEFDGNGRKITIKGFASFENADIQAGLFAQVYENMIVKNVVVEYYSTPEFTGDYTFGYVSRNGVTYTDLCASKEVNYTSLNFGGITAVNNGIITNCSVLGSIAVRASTVEQKKFSSGSSYEINFFVGGVVSKNASTGYITNSTSSLNIFAQANIGGFAYSNEGKIVSCSVEKDTTIYGYNTDLEKTIVIKVAGFVVENSNHISMSYVNLEANEQAFSSIYYGTMSAKDLSAGFVYSNSGSISDAYVQMSKTGVNNNTFAGFVYLNAGSISRAYAYINKGSKEDSNDSMFAPSGTVGLNNCIEFIIETNSYANGIEQGLTIVDAGMRYNKDYYEKQNFAFGDNESAVWMINSGNLPKLVSTQEKVEYLESEEYDGLLPLFTEVEFGEDGIKKYKYEPNFAYYGTKENPYIVHDLETWKDYFTAPNNDKAYFRIVKDIDFVTVGDNPSTSKTIFKGNIQGNNMTLSNIMLYSTESLESLGLFRSMQSAKDNEIKNAVRNLTITTTSVWASKTSSVGLLAGIIEDFNLYNITIDSEGVIIVGGNAVGGIAGVVRGEFDLDQISSNIGANSTRASTQYNYSIYISRNNKKDVSYNLKNVYYAGSVVGILDGFNRSLFDINDGRDIIEDKFYNMVRNVSVNGKITIIGDTVGGVFGLVGERVYVKNVNVNISGDLAGVQYSAGIAGENRGVIDNGDLITSIADNVFSQSTNVSSGLVGFNLGGLIRNAKVQVNIRKLGYGKIVGGAVGRNIYGTVNNIYVDGELNAYFTGGIVGVSYTKQMLINATTGAGTLSADCKANNAFLIPKGRIENGQQKGVKYTENGAEIMNYTNVSLSRKAFEYMVNSSKEFYYYSDATQQDNPTFDMLIIRNKVLGLVVGLGYEDSVVNKTGDKYLIDLQDDQITFNSILSDASIEENKQVILSEGLTFDFAKLNVLTDSSLEISKSIDFVMYTLGAKVTAFDSWYNSYSNEFIVVTTTKLQNRQPNNT